VRSPWRRAAPPSATQLAAQEPDGVSLEESYELCRRLNARRRAAFYWSTRLLPRVKQHHVHALYGFCRYADDVVDHVGPATFAEREAALTAFGDRFFDDLQLGRSSDPVLKAVIHTVKAFDIEPGCFRRLLHSMAMDLAVTRYETWDDLLRYMDGSAAVVGEMLLPILEPTDEAAGPHARDLGYAFQLTNILRDVGEDLDRDRVYLPRVDLDRYAADPAGERDRIRAGAAASNSWIDLMRFEVGRCRNLYVSADLGIGMLPERSARAVRAARLLYSSILDRIEQRGYDVFTSRASVPTWQKVVISGRMMFGAG
jgi:15-cis-phytoene synthase